MSDNLYQHFHTVIERQPEATFMTTSAGRVIRYGDLPGLTAGLAGALQAMGVAPGDRVAVQVEKSPETILLYLACLRMGGVYLPLNTAYTGEEIAYFIGDAKPALFVCRPEDEANARALCADAAQTNVATLGGDGRGGLIEAAARAEPMSGITPRTADDLASILYTSGTTGRSKGAMLTHGNLLSNARALAETWRFTPDDRLIHALPIFHIHGLFVACNTVLASGASMLYLPRFDANEVIDAMVDGTVLMGVPTFYTRLLKSSRLTRDAVAAMRLFVSGSAPLTTETHNAFSERTGVAILERYGMTETGMNSSNPYDGERRAGTVGFPLPGVDIRITQPEQATALPDGEVGMIEVRGPNVFSGYWGMPEKTAEELRSDGWFITGDLGMIDDRGYLQIVGRGKDLVISGGYNVYPREVEQIIDEHPDVEESAVIGVAHPDFGEGVTAVVVPAAGANPSESSIQQALDGRLARFKQPKRVMFVDALPRNAMGKVQKNQLRDTYARLYSASE